MIGTISAGTFPENSLPRAILDQMQGFGGTSFPQPSSYFSIRGKFNTYTVFHSSGDAYGPIYDGQYVLAENFSSGTKTYKIGDPLYKVIAAFSPPCADNNTTNCGANSAEWTLMMYNGIAQSDLSIVSAQMSGQPYECVTVSLCWAYYTGRKSI